MRFTLITQMRAAGLAWRDVAAEFHVKDAESFAQTYRNEVDRRASVPFRRLLRRAAGVPG